MTKRLSGPVFFVAHPDEKRVELLSVYTHHPADEVCFVEKIPRSPRIVHVSWGHLVIEGVGEGKDFKLYPGGGREWDWGETGTDHDPGIQPADVEELLEKGAEVVVLSRGMNSALQTSPETISMLERLGIPYHIGETKKSVALYNELAETKPVGGLFHSTC